MPSSSTLLARVVVALQIGFLCLTTSFARERGPRVEVMCPSQPIPVTLGKNHVLVYELHITNFDSMPLTIKQVEIFADGKPVAVVENNKLSAATIRVGAATAGASGAAAEDSLVIAPGGRNIIFMWIELPANGAAPAGLRHRIVLSSAPAGAASATDATLEDFEVSVSRDSAPVLSPPFNGGIWLAGDGPDNASNHRRSILAIDGHIYSPERFAIDWIKVGPNGDTRHDGSTKNENWWAWGEPILAVADGRITEVVDEFPDNTPRVLPPVTLDNIAGNHIILQIAPNRFVTYAHLQKGSITVRVGDHVRAGEVLALLGNSGNTTGAHLHLQVTDGNSVLQSQGVPFVFAGFTYLGPGADYPEKQVSDAWRDSIPPGNGVLRVEPVKK
jgi:hypothetical protein